MPDVWAQIQGGEVMAIELHHLHPSHDDEVARLKARIAELEEERRWRKFPDEKPEHNGIYIVLLGEHTRTLDMYDTDKGKFRTYMPTAWLPLPSAPKEKK